jgi:hypothetical protein
MSVEIKPEDVLADIMEEFNDRFVEWQNQFGMGANFGFHYRPEDGLKEIFAMEVKPIPSDRPTTEEDPRVRQAAAKFASPIGSGVSEVEKAYDGGSAGKVP